MFVFFVILLYYLDFVNNFFNSDDNKIIITIINKNYIVINIQLKGPSPIRIS